MVFIILFHLTVFFIFSVKSSIRYFSPFSLSVYFLSFNTDGSNTFNDILLEKKEYNKNRQHCHGRQGEYQRIVTSPIVLQLSNQLSDIPCHGVKFRIVNINKRSHKIIPGPDRRI